MTTSTSKHPPKHPSEPQAETTDGLPPGAHAPSSIGNGMASMREPDEGTSNDRQDVTEPEGHVEDPTLSPKEQAEHAQALAELGPLQAGKKRVKIRSAIMLDGQHLEAGKVVDLDEGLAHAHRERVEVLRGTHTHPPAKGAKR